MPHILVIDDETVFHEMVSRTFQGDGFTFSFASDGKEGLALASTTKPDLIISDVMMPEFTGYEVTQALRRKPEFANLPILMLTSQSGLQDKLKSFEAGADDHLTKPFEPAELQARVNVLLRRAEQKGDASEVKGKDEASIIAFHSLRGGCGCSSLSVNMALGLRSLWQMPTVLLDVSMMAGQVALMLNSSLKRTWGDISQYTAGEIDEELLDSIIARTDSGLSYIAAPTLPSEADLIKPMVLNAALQILRRKFDYIVADVAHDFQEISLQVLDVADKILLVGAPDLASVRALSAALDTYKKLGYPDEKIKIILNATFPRLGLPKEKIEAALGKPVSVIIPNQPDVFVNAINFGQPFITHKPNELASAVLEDYAFLISKPNHRKSRPEKPTEAWQRVYKRYTERRAT